jgi:hypothetical protein
VDSVIALHRPRPRTLWWAATSIVVVTALGLPSPSVARSPVEGTVAVAVPRPAPAGRDARLWPFTQHSIWNTPRGASSGLVFAGLGAVGSVFGDDSVIVMAPAAPRTAVYVNYSDWRDPRPGARCARQGPLLARIPLPPTLVLPDEGKTPNMSAAVLLRDGRTVYQTQPLQRCVAGSYATSHYRSPNADIVTGDGRLGAHGGSGLSSLGGTLRLGELLPGAVIHHALAVSIQARTHLAFVADASRGFRWPAARADGYASRRTYGGAVPALEMGALLTLRPGFAVSRLSSTPGRILATALRDYGAYVVDDSAWNAVGVMVEWGDRGRVTTQFRRAYGYQFGGRVGSTPFLRDMATILANLYVVSDSGPSSVGGRGPRLAPWAPPIIAP